MDDLLLLVSFEPLLTLLLLLLLLLLPLSDDEDDFFLGFVSGTDSFVFAEDSLRTFFFKVVFEECSPEDSFDSFGIAWVEDLLDE